MEAKKIKNIITAIGNPILNNELKKIENLIVINNDIQYQDGILEVLEVERNIDFLILSQILSGNFQLEELIEIIQEKNSKIKIILILENYSEELERILIKKGVYRIFYNNKIEIKDIIKIINEDEKMEKYNEEIRKEIEELKEYIKNNKIEKNSKKINKEKNIQKNNNKVDFFKNKLIKNYLTENKIIKNTLNKILNNILNKKIFSKLNNKLLMKKIIKNKNTENNKIISILGNNGSGKSIFSVILSNSLKKYYNKILIIDFDILNNSLHTILGVKKYSEKIRKIMSENNFDNSKINIENLIININNKIDLISGINLIFDSKNKISKEKLKNIMEILSKKYDIIITDTTSECFFEYTKELIDISNACVFLTEANLVELGKSKRLLNMYYENWNINKNKIKIVFNKFNNKSIDINLLKKIYSDYEILGTIKSHSEYNSLINMNCKNILLKNKTLKNYKKIEEKIFINNGI